MALMFSVLAMVFVAEMGDKTQFLLIAMTSKYKLRDIMIGTALAIAILNALAIGLGTVVGNYIPQEYISVVAGLAFFYFAFSSLGGEDEEHAVAFNSGKGQIFKVFGTFFLAELGDKTQLTALALSAEQTGGEFMNSFFVWAGACTGLYLADMLGLLVGFLLGKKLPENVFAWISFLLFAVFGVIKLLSGLEIIFSGRLFVAILLTVIASVIFALACFVKVLSRRKEENRTQV